VAEDLRHDAELLALLDQERRVRVAQIVEPLGSKAGPRKSSLEALGGVPGVERVAESSREHEVAIVPGGSCCKPLLELATAVLAKAGQDLRRDPERSLRPVRLRLAHVADTLVTKGTALAALGRATEGRGVLRAGQELAEALGLGATLVRGYNNLTHIEGSRDPRAALDLARVGLPIARRLGQRTTAAVLLANGAESALRTGDWPWALAELEAALADELEGSDRMLTLPALSSLRALRGEPVAALLDEIARLVGASSDPAMLSAQQGIATGFAAFASGRLADARGAWHGVAAISAANLPESLARAARAALWAGDAAAARADLAALDAAGVHGPAIEADRATIRAGLAALEGRPADALASYRDVLRTWRSGRRSPGQETIVADAYLPIIRGHNTKRRPLEMRQRRRSEE
jgi:hypothetical protein